MDTDTLLSILAILGMRILGLSLATVRTLLMIRGQKVFSFGISLFEFATYAVSIGWVVSDLKNFWNLAAYAAGSAVGIYIGMAIEARFVTGYASVDVISPYKAHEIAAAVRAAGFGATEGWGQGADSMVGTIRVVVRRQEIKAVLAAINSVDHKAFITVEETRALRRGYLRRISH
jgi:uncharacterized protein YebE (UPF0316 family)